MRTSNVIASIALLGIAVVGIALSPAISFDGTRPPEGAAAALPEATPSPAAGSPSLGGATPLAAVPAAPAVAPLTLPPRSAMPHAAGGVPRRHAGAAPRQDRAGHHGVRIRRRAGRSRRHLEARPDVRGRRRRQSGQGTRLRIFPPPNHDAWRR